MTYFPDIPLRRLALCGGIALTALAVACGGGSDDDGDGATATATTTSAATSAATSEATTAATTAPTSEATSSGGGSGIPALTSQECRDAAIALAAAFQSGAAGIGGVTDTQLAELEETLDAVATDAPDEVRGALETFAEAWSTFTSSIQESGWNPTSGTAPPAAVMAAMTAFQDSEFLEASETISTWFDGNCET